MFYANEEAHLDTICAGAAATWAHLGELREDSSAEATEILTEWPGSAVDSVVFGMESLDGEPPPGWTPPAPSNGIDYPNDFDNAAWTKTGVTITADATTDPDGGSGADLVVEDSSSGSHSVNQVIDNGIVADGAAYAYVCAKTAGRDWIRISALGQPVFAWFNVTTGTAGSAVNCTSSVTSLGSGWYQCEIQYTHDSSASPSLDIMVTDSDWGGTMAGSGSNAVYLFAAMVANV